MEDEWLLKAGPDRVKGPQILLVRIKCSVLCACAIRIPHPVTLVKKIDHVKYMKIPCVKACATGGSPGGLLS